MLLTNIMTCLSVISSEFKFPWILYLYFLHERWLPPMSKKIQQPWIILLSWMHGMLVWSLFAKLLLGFQAFGPANWHCDLYFTWHELHGHLYQYDIYSYVKKCDFQLVKKKYSHPHMLTYFKLCTTQIIQGHNRSFTGKPCIPGAGARLQDNMSDQLLLHSAIVTLEWKCSIIE